MICFLLFYVLPSYIWDQKEQNREKPRLKLMARHWLSLQAGRVCLRIFPKHTLNELPLLLKICKEKRCCVTLYCPGETIHVPDDPNKPCIVFHACCRQHCSYQCFHKQRCFQKLCFQCGCRQRNPSAGALQSGGDGCMGYAYSPAREVRLHRFLA